MHGSSNGWRVFWKRRLWPFTMSSSHRQCMTAWLWYLAIAPNIIIYSVNASIICIISSRFYGGFGNKTLLDHAQRLKAAVHSLQISFLEQLALSKSAKRFNTFMSICLKISRVYKCIFWYEPFSPFTPYESCSFFVEIPQDILRKL